MESAPHTPPTETQSKRGAIVAAAVELFSTKGYVETSVRDVVALSSTSLATFYRHFGSKLDLLRALVNPRLEEVWRCLHAALANETDPVERLMVAIRTVFEVVANDEILSALMVYRAAREEVKPEIDAMNRQIDTLGVALVRQAMGEDAWLEDPGAAVVMIRMVVEGWFTWEKAIDGGVSRERLTDAMEAILRAAIREFIRKGKTGLGPGPEQRNVA